MTHYRFETFRPAADSETGAPDARTAAFVQAIYAGFHDDWADADMLKARTRRILADRKVFTGAYVDEAPVSALDPGSPVATFVHFEKFLNVGLGALVPAHLITAVTVRPTHRRRGLLRTLMTANLTNAKEAGYAFAALTASEGGIYTRFGFGATTWRDEVEVDTSTGFGLMVESDRRVEVCHPHALRTLAEPIHRKFLETTPGAMERQASYIDMAAGDLHPGTNAAEDKRVRSALHYDESGEPDGFVSYRFDGWDAEPRSITVIDIVAVSDAAYAALWEFLGSIDLVDRVRFDHAAQDSPLPWLLKDPRRVKVRATVDDVWLRILDPLAALRARPWPVPGRLTIAVDDPHGFASGVFLVDSTEDTPVIERLPDDTRADLGLMVAELGSIYLGAADPVVLARAGRIEARTAEAARLARTMFALERRPYSPNGF